MTKQKISWVTTTTKVSCICRGGVSGGNNISNVSNVYNVTNVSNITNLSNFSSLVNGPPGVIPMFNGTGLADSSLVQSGSSISTTGSISIGAAASGTAQLTVAGSTSDSTTDALHVTDSSGDTLARFTDNGQVDLGTGPGVAFGNTIVEPNHDTGINGIITADKFTTTSSQVVGSMSIYIGAVASYPYDQYQFAIYVDNSGVPGAWVASSSVGTLTADTWNTLPISATLASGTSYWLAYTTTSNNSNYDDPYYAVTGSATHAYANYSFGTGSAAGMPSSFPTPLTANAYTHSIFATTVGTGPALTLSPIGTMTATGAAVFKDTNNATDAFQVQNSSDSAVLSVDTTNGNVGVGTASPSANLDVEGTAIFKNKTDSATAFQIQNASGNPALVFDTVTGNLTVNTPSGCSYSSYTNYVASLSPTSYWKLEDTGTTAADSSGNNNTGTLSNVTTGITPGPFSCATAHTAMSFNGGSGSQITTAKSYTDPTTYSQVAMFKATAAGTIIGFSDGSANYDRQLYVGGDNKLYARIYDGTGGGNEQINSSATVTDGNWHIAVVTESSAGLYLYLDGSLVASNSSYTTPENYTGTWYIGNDESNSPFTGDIGEAAVLPTALTPLQVQTLSTYSGFYNATLASIGIGTTSPAANLDVEGTALVKNSENSATAFQVQDSSGNTVLDVDTANGNVGIGTSAPTNARLAIVGATNDSTTNALSLTSSTGVTLAQVGDDGSVSLGESQPVFGNSSSGDYTGGGYYNAGLELMQAQSFTTTSGGAVSSISTYIGQPISGTNNSYQMAIYADNAGVPGAYIASTAVGTLTGSGWNSLPISATLTAATKYWLVYWTNTNDGNHNGQNFISGYSGPNTFYQGYATWQSGGSNGMPTTFPAGSGPSSGYETSIYVSYATPVTAVSLNASGDLTSNGNVLIQNSSSDALDVTDATGGTALYVDGGSHYVGVNTSNTGGFNFVVQGTTALGGVNNTTALKIVNASAQALFTADTSGMVLTVSGSATTFATLTLDNAHFSSTQTTAPTISTPTNCGTTPAATITAGSTDSAGSFTITTGSGTPSTCDTVVMFNQAYGSAPKSIMLTPTTAIGGATVSTNGNVSASATTDFTAQIDAPTASTAYSYYYWVVQ